MRRSVLAVRDLWKNFTELLGLLTIIPVSSEHRLELNSLYLISLVGLIKGLLVSSSLPLIYFFSGEYLFMLVALVIAIHYIIQGFLHADGFIDFSEAIIASRSGADPYKVMKDVHKGSFAIVVFAVYMLILYSTLVTLFTIKSLPSIFLIIVSSETFSLISSLFLSYIGNEPPEGMGRIFKKNLRERDLVISILISSAAILILSTTLGVAIAKIIILLITSLLSLTMSTALTYFLSKRILGFVSGDVLGFCIELTYLLILSTGVLF
ncbi:MAG: adenosylcobinamide-GDP ribazoletransferase [Sulfolobales archaeon]